MLTVFIRRRKLDEQKKNRLAAAVTVNVIILMVILVAVIIYQLVEIVGQNNEYKQLAREYEYYSRLLEDKKDELDFFESEQYEEYLLELAFKLGYHYPN